MATLKQGIEYEITAKDNTSAGTDSALSKIIEAEKRAKEAQKQEQEEAKNTKGVFAAVTQALQGNFESLGRVVLQTAAKISGMKVSAQVVGAIGLAVTGVASAVNGLREAFANSAAEAAELERLRISGAIEGAGEEAKRFADEMERARQIAADQKKMFEDEVEAIRKMAAAENEFAKQQELALAGGDEARKAEIEKKYSRGGMVNDAYLNEELRQAEIASAKDEIERIRAEIENTESESAKYDELGKAQATQLNKSQNRGFWSTLADNLFSKGKTEAEDDALARNVAETTQKKADAEKRLATLRQQMEMAEHRLEMANAKEEIAIVEEQAADQKMLNEDWQKHDEEVAKAAEQSAERIAEVKRRAEDDIQEVRLQNIQEAQQVEQQAISENESAQARLAAARNAVRQAWGWYRDKDSMAAQLAEEKANADAERQFEKDFSKLSFRRDWRTAKNLSVDQEAVRRVALAKEEESAAENAVLETARCSARSAAALEAIKATITGGDD